MEKAPAIRTRRVRRIKVIAMIISLIAVLYVILTPLVYPRLAFDLVLVLADDAYERTGFPVFAKSSLEIFKRKEANNLWPSAWHLYQDRKMSRLIKQNILIRAPSTVCDRDMMGVVIQNYNMLLINQTTQVTVHDAAGRLLFADTIRGRSDTQVITRPRSEMKLRPRGVIEWNRRELRGKDREYLKITTWMLQKDGNVGRKISTKLWFVPKQQQVVAPTPQRIEEVVSVTDLFSTEVEIIQNHHVVKIYFPFEDVGMALSGNVYVVLKNGERHLVGWLCKKLDGEGDGCYTLDLSSIEAKSSSAPTHFEITFNAGISTIVSDDSQGQCLFLPTFTIPIQLP